MVQLSEEVSKLIEMRVAERGYASADELIRDVLADPNVAGGQSIPPTGREELDLDNIPYDPDWTLSAADQKLLDEVCPGDGPGWLSEEESEAQFAEFRARWLAARR